MSGIIIYSKFEAERNEFAIKKFKENLDVKLVFEDEVDFDEKTDFVINRTNSYLISSEFEKRGIRVFNPSSLTKIANDKSLCYSFMKKNNIEIMEVNYKKTPLVVKPKNGKGGFGVRLIKNGEIPEDDGNTVFQKPASDLGKDLRVWLIGKKIVFSALRESKADFRSNFCLGGNASEYKLSAEEEKLIYKIASLLDFDYIGIDFVFNNGKIVFNEIEDSVGARMVYSLSNVDIISLYSKYILKVL